MRGFPPIDFGDAEIGGEVVPAAVVAPLEGQVPRHHVARAEAQIVSRTGADADPVSGERHAVFEVDAFGDFRPEALRRKKT